MSAAKTLVRRALDIGLSLLLAPPWGTYVSRRFVSRIFQRFRTVTHNSVSMLFAVPNWLAEYRASTFSTKEPETLEWISSSLQRGSVLWDVGLMWAPTVFSLLGPLAATFMHSNLQSLMSSYWRATFFSMMYRIGSGSSLSPSVTQRGSAPSGCPQPIGRGALVI